MSGCRKTGTNGCGVGGGRHRRPARWGKESTDLQVGKQRKESTDDQVWEGKHRWSGGGKKAQIIRQERDRWSCVGRKAQMVRWGRGQMARWEKEGTDVQVREGKRKITKDGVMLRNNHYLVMQCHIQQENITL